MAENPFGAEATTHLLSRYKSLEFLISSGRDKITAIYKRVDALAARNPLPLQNELAALHDK
ncbi:hypothetical protein K505DRAFT_235178 [Melanomma pulvis-pyrius CBS 109.77]|uniref:Uncharacterized protein n=1 Tax=Melanomma pulvis-pyrius CBS 109.77 TaxID=1314802 RepID=A0A6A6XMK0_9PLEO|nr:hypothetical protein K505DRAFT_235178 [Melanomma pulvis-pyrius CBS 109.77]